MTLRRGMSRACAAVAALLSLACARAPEAAPEVPAVLVDVTAESRAAVSEAVTAALHGHEVRLADSALTRDSLLVVERFRPRDAAGVPLDGRDRRRPERFHLVKSGAGCVLIHERTGTRYPLSGTACAPL